MSDSIRIFQLAKELNISHTDILDFLKSKDISVSSHMSPIDGKTQQLVYTEFAKDRQSAERDRKEQVRKEIHDSKVVMKTKSVKKFKIMSVEDQRKTDKKKAEAPIKVCPKPTGSDKGGFEGEISKFRYIARTVNPREAYEIYREGPGGNWLTSAVNAYKLKLSFMKDDEEVTSFSV